MEPIFFETPAAFRSWLEANHASANELMVGFRKEGSGLPSITWPEAVDQALCFGWIDGVRRSLGDDAYVIRFTPRRRGSIWSRVNIARFAELKAQGLVAPAGEVAFADGKVRTEHYSYENEARELTPEQVARFEAAPEAWAWFQSRPPSWRKKTIWWVVSAKQQVTRETRLSKLIDDCAALARAANPAAQADEANCTAAPGAK